MKKNLLFFTLILSGLSTHVFAGKSTYKEGPLEIQTLEETLKKIKDPELKREVEKLREGYAKKLAERSKNSYMGPKKPSSYEAPELERETPEGRLNKIKDPELKREVEALRANYEDNLAKKRGPNSYMDPKKPSSYEAPELERETPEGRLNKIKDSELKKKVAELRSGYQKKLAERSKDSYIPNQKPNKTGNSDATSTTSEGPDTF